MSKIHRTCYWHHFYGDEFEACAECRRELIDAEELFCLGAFTKDHEFLPNPPWPSRCCHCWPHSCFCEEAWNEFFRTLEPDDDGICRLLPKDVAPAQFGSLYHEGYVHAYSITKDDADAHDAVQTAFYKLHRMPESPRHLRATFHRAVHNAAIDIVRRRKHHLQIEDEWLPDRNGNRVELLDEEVLTLSEAMEGLTPGDQQILRMHYIEGLSHKQIAERLGVTVTTVNNRLVVARRRLKKVLTNAGAAAQVG